MLVIMICLVGFLEWCDIIMERYVYDMCIGGLVFVLDI